MTSRRFSRVRRSLAAALARSAAAPTRAFQIASAGGPPRVALTRVLAVAFALALVTSALAPAATAAPATSAALDRGPPDGMVGVPGDRVGAVQADSGGGGGGPGANGGPPADAGPPGDVGPPSHANIPTHAAAWSVMADKHAGDLSLEVGETSSGRLALVLSDAENHEGREVAVRRDTLRTAVGHEPTVAHGLHESGDRWTSQIRYEGEYAVLEVPKFSSNTVTFDGEIRVTGDPADDGAAFSYDVTDLDAVDDFRVNVTGRINSQSETLSGSTTAGSSEAISIGGNMAPTGPNSGEPEISVTGTESTENDVLLGSDTVDVAYNENNGTWSTTFANPNPGQNITEARVTNLNEANAIYYITLEDEDGNSLTSETWNSNRDGVTRTISGSETFTGDQLTFTFHADDNYVDSGSGGSEFRADFLKTTRNITVSAPSGDSVDLGSPNTGETVSAPLSLAQSDDSLTFDGLGPLDWSLEMTERTETVDPAVTINGETTSHSGTVAAGETVSLDANPDWVQEGTNQITVSTTSPATGPVGQLALDYRHAASSDQSVEYHSEAWSEQYNVSRTFASARSGASITVPFSSERVVAIRDVEMRTNGGEWSSLPESDYSLDGTNLTAALGDIDAETTVDVRATGTKVQVENGAIEVLDPTIEGNSLDSKIKITDHSDGFAIGVGGTAEGEFVHYTHSESWTSVESSTVHKANGSQEVRLPNAGAGSSTRVASYPLEVTPDVGEVEVEMVETDSSPVFKVDPRDGASEVRYRYHNTKSGDKYVLYSQSHSIARDTATAESPVSLFGSFHTETLEIFNADADDGGETSSSTSGGGGGAIGAARTTANGVNPLLVLFASGVFVVGLAYTNYRWSVDARLTGGAATVVALLALEIVSPGTISSALGSAIAMIGSALSEQVGFIVVLGLPFGLWLIYRWWQTRSKAATTPDTSVTFELRGDDK